MIVAQVTDETIHKYLVLGFIIPDKRLIGFYRVVVDIKEFGNAKPVHKAGNFIYGGL